MATGHVTTVEEYLDSLPPDRRDAIEAVRRVILRNLPEGFVEAIGYGMITWQVPLSVYPDTYNGQPLLLAALASQKSHMAVYLMSIYGQPELRAWFEAAYRATGKRFDAGKSCVRFRRLADLPVELVGEAIARVDIATFVATHESNRKAVRATAKKGRQAADPKRGESGAQVPRTKPATRARTAARAKPST